MVNVNGNVWYSVFSLTGIYWTFYSCCCPKLLMNKKYRMHTKILFMLSFKCAYLTNICDYFQHIYANGGLFGSLPGVSYVYGYMCEWVSEYINIVKNFRIWLQSLSSAWHGIFAHILSAHPPLSLSVSQHATRWTSVTGFVIKKTHQSQQQRRLTDWLGRPLAYLLSTLSALAAVCYDVYVTLFSPSPGSHWQLIESPLQRHSFPFRFHCKTNVMSWHAAHLIPISFPFHSHLMRLMKKVLIVDSCFAISTSLALSLILVTFSLSPGVKLRLRFHGVLSVNSSKVKRQSSVSQVT